MTALVAADTLSLHPETSGPWHGLVVPERLQDRHRRAVGADPHPVGGRGGLPPPAAAGGRVAWALSPHPPYATVKQAAAALNLHPETVRALARSRAFPRAVMRGRGSPTAIPWADVEAYLARTRPSADDATAREVAAALSRHTSTVTALVAAAVFPNAYRAESGRTSRVRIPWGDIENFRKNQPRVNV
jgi:hypothetical protein